jgi:hypothetical protein
MLAFPLRVLNISSDSILHASPSNTAVRYSLLRGIPPFLTKLLLTKFVWHKRIVILSKKLFSLNSSVMDDNHDTYKTANIKINQLFRTLD